MHANHLVDIMYKYKGTFQTIQTWT